VVVGDQQGIPEQMLEGEMLQSGRVPEVKWGGGATKGGRGRKGGGGGAWDPGMRFLAEGEGQVEYLPV
jgi:hypothetical protein